MLPAPNRLRHRRDLEFLFKRGEKIFSSSFVVRFLASPTPRPRFTVVVGKKVEKSAVRRNLIKRRTREALRLLLKHDFPDFPALDAVFWVKPECEAATFDFHKGKAELQSLLQKMLQIASSPTFGKVKPSQLTSPK